jgi:hypothetical protein
MELIRRQRGPGAFWEEKGWPSMISTLQHYLAQVQEQLPFGGSRGSRILREIETHLLESWQDEQRRGISKLHVYRRSVMKNTRDQSPEQQGILTLFTRRTLMVGIGILTVLFALLLADIFFLQYPSVSQTGDANLQRWIGPGTVKIAGILPGLLFGGCYLAVAIGGTGEEEPARARKLGAGAGGGAGAIVILL